MTILSQVAVATAPFPVWDVVVKIGEGVAALLVAWIGHGIRAMKAELQAVRDEQSAIRVELERWRVFLVGITGDNGLNSRVRSLEDDREERLRGRRHQGRRDGDA